MAELVAPLLYRVSEVMSTLRISRPTVYRMAARGDLELVKIGTATRFTSESVQAVSKNGAGKMQASTARALGS